MDLLILFQLSMAASSTFALERLYVLSMNTEVDVRIVKRDELEFK